jgi:hypothetical protein
MLCCSEKENIKTGRITLYCFLVTACMSIVTIQLLTEHTGSCSLSCSHVDFAITSGKRTTRDYVNELLDSLDSNPTRTCHSNPPLPPPTANATCALVANGPSLNLLPPQWGQLLRQKFDLVMGVNRIFLGMKRFNLTLDLYMAMDNLLVAQSGKEIQELRAFKFVLANLANHFPCHLDDTFFTKLFLPQPDFSKNLTAGVAQGWTVTYMSLQVLYAMGCVEVVIVGLDHSWDPSPSHNNSHFDKNYLQPGQKFNPPHFDKIDHYYHVAREEYEADGRRIVDATVNGSLTIFEKMNFDQIPYPA